MGLVQELGRGRQLIETHISWVFLGEHEVLKVKKPVALGFLDFSTLEARKRACENELALNQRLSSGVYRRIAPISVDDTGRHQVDGTGALSEYAVVMRRLDDATRADTLLSEQRLTREHIRRIAVRLADFHAAAASSAEIDRFGGVDTIRANVEENFSQASALSHSYITAEQEAEIESHQLGFLSDTPDAFEARVRAGKIRDGHGDLRLEHIYFEGTELNIIDCIEFNDRFRYADVCADLAFLVMDLRHNGAPELAEDLLAAYSEATGDMDLYSLIDFYEAYRAYVRAKIAAFVAADESIGEAARSTAASSARAYFLHALAAQRERVDTPQLVAVGGVIAAGKSTTSARIAQLLHCPVVDTDRTRKQLLDVSEEQALHDSAFSGNYSPERTQAVYEEALRRARVVLASGRSAVLDASFNTRERRQAVRKLCADQGVPFQFVWCHVPRSVALERLRLRERGPAVSDGRREIYDDFAQAYQTPDELPGEELRQLNTNQSDAQIEEQLRRWFAS